MEEKAPTRSTMVSRLPKFGGRSSTGGASPVSNGCTQPTTTIQDGKTSPPGTRPNGVIPTSPFSLKLKKDEGMTPSGPNMPTTPGDGGEDKAESQLQLPSMTKEMKNGSPGTPKIQSPLNGVPKTGNNCSSIPARTGLDSRLVRPRLGSSSPRSSSQDSLSQSSDSLKILALDNMVRSNSFTHFKQIPSPTNQPMTRSFSFNRAVELAKPLANTQLPLGGQYSRTPPPASSLPTPSIPSAPSTPSALKKPLLPSCVLTKSLGGTAGSLGYRLARSGQAKQQKPLFPGRVKGDIRSSATTGCKELGTAINTELTGEAEKADSHSDSDGSFGAGGGKGEGSAVLRQSCGQTAGETLEDMSLSSASSLDRVDTSEEFLDEFDSVPSDGDVSDNRKTGSTKQTCQYNFLNETIDWGSIDLTKESPMQDSQGPLGMGPERGDAPQASSVELSPSNSSGGTYMWDEEGLGPFGEPATHPDNYDDSELNSIDILNNLDPRGTGELDDDDLMLDVDLPEDGMHGQHTHTHTQAENYTEAQHLMQLRQHSYMTMLDELTLEHMTEDCSSLKNQLLRLKTLLQVWCTSAKRHEQTQTCMLHGPKHLEELIEEVQVLRQELRTRDKTIAQLTLQCQQLQQHQHHLLNTQLQCLGTRAPWAVNGRDSPASAAHSAAQHEWKAPAVMLQNSVTPGAAGSSCPSMLQPPRFQKRISPALKPGVTSGFASLKQGSFLGPNQTKQLPPPSRGLPCFNTGSQVQALSLRRTSLLQPCRASDPCRAPQCTKSSPVEPDQSMLKNLGSAKTLIPLSRLGPPKPKIP
uniref:Coiled-coil serine-rich protein 2a n=1 Tax=Echeneis naucrates TaxID=173247 RepID=A0A665W0F2_ECHNA